MRTLRPILMVALKAWLVWLDNLLTNHSAASLKTCYQAELATLQSHHENGPLSLSHEMGFS